MCPLQSLGLQESVDAAPRHAMLGFIRSLQECVVRSGFKGRRLSKLWTDLEESIGRKVSVPLKNFFWRELVALGKLHHSDPKKLYFYLSPSGRARTPSSLPEGLGFRDPERREATAEELEQPWEVFEQEYNGLWLRVVAHGQARALSLGITDPDSNMVAVTYAVLELVTKRREIGITQVTLSKSLRMEAKNVFYHVKKLKKLGMIQRRKMVVRREDNDKSYQTNLITATRFLKEGDSGDVDDDQDEDDDEEEEEDNPAARGRAVMYGDMAMRICSLLNKANKNILVEANLQRYVSTTTGSQRRGVWPNIRRKLLDTGYIVLCSATVEQPDGRRTTNRCVKLIKMPHNIRELDRAFETLTSLAATTDDGLVSRPHRIIHDYPLEYQMWRLIQDSGAHGVYRSTLKFSGIHHKIVGKRLDTLTKDRAIVSAVSTSYGKIRTFLLKSSSAPLSEHEAKARQDYFSKVSKSTPKKETAASASTPAKKASHAPQAAEEMTVDSYDEVVLLDDDSPLPIPTPAATAATPIKSSNRSSGVGPKHTKLPTLKAMIRKQFLLDLLTEQQVLVVSALRKILWQHEESSGVAVGEVDAKTVRKITDEMVAENLAYYRSIGVRNESGSGSKIVEILVKADLDENTWREICKNMSLDELLKSSIPTAMTRPQMESLHGSLKVDSLDENGVIRAGEYVKTAKKAQSGSTPSRKRNRIDENEEEDASISEEPNGEEVPYAESSDEEMAAKKPRRGAGRPRKHPRTDQTQTPAPKEEDQQPQNEDNEATETSDFTAFHARVSLGMEKAKLLRVSAIHAWLCSHLFGEDRSGALERLLPNNVQNAVFQHFKKLGELEAAAPSRSAPISSSTSVARSSDPARSASASTVPESQDEQVRLMAMLLGPSRRSASADTEDASQALPAPSQISAPTNVSKSKSASEKMDIVDEPMLTWDGAKKRWFNGPEFNVDTLMPDMPLYVYLISIGLTGHPPGLNLCHTALETKIRDLPEESRAFLLQRSQYARSMNKIIDILKQLNLIHPRVSLVQAEEVSSEVEAIVPFYILNPIGIVWYRPVATDENEMPPEKTFMYQFDRPVEQGDPEVSNFWWRLQRESLSFIREVSMQGLDMAEVNTPPPTKSFPSMPGLPLICCSNNTWTGANHKKTTKAFKAAWKVVEAEMAAAKQTGPTHTMIELAEEWNIKPTTVLRWYNDYQTTLKSRKRQHDGDDSAGPQAKRSKTSRHVNADDEENPALHSLRAAQTSSQAKTKNTRSINIELGSAAKRTSAAKRATKRDEDDEGETRAGHGEAGDEHDAEDASAAGSLSRHRWTYKQQQTFIDHFIQQKARARAHLDDISTLLEGIDKDKLARAANRPWETLEKHLRDSVSTKVGLYNMASKISAAMRELSTEEDVETMDVDNTPSPPPPPVFELPASVDDFRKSNNIIYTNYTDGHEDHRTTMQGHHATRSVAVVPLHPNLIAESEFFNFTSQYDSASCSRAPASRWMLDLPPELDPDYLIISDFVKSLLMVEPDIELKTVISRIIPKELNKAYADCMDSLKLRKVLTHGKSSERTRLSAQWLGWTKHADQAIKFGKEARQNLDSLADENAGWDAQTQAAPPPLHGPPRDAQQEALLLHPWHQTFDPFSSGPQVASILHQTYRRDIVLDINVGSVTSVHRRFRKQSTKIPKMTKQAQNAEDDVLVRFQWWREQRLLTRYDPDVIDYTAPTDWDHLVGAQDTQKRSNDPEILQLDFPSNVHNPTAWDLFCSLETQLGKSESFIQTCRYTLDKIIAANSASIDLFSLEQKLINADQLETFDSEGVLIPSFEGSALLREVLQALENHRLVYRVLGALSDAWVAAEHATRWTIVQLKKEDGTPSPAGDDDYLVVYNPWTNLDGTLNEQTLGRLRAHVALSVIASPGISEERILDTFDVFRPAVAREILRLLQADGLVTLQYTQYSVPSWLSTASATSQDSSQVQIAAERDYHEYIQRQYSHIRRGTLRPSHIVHKGIWPAEDIYMRL